MRIDKLKLTRYGSFTDRTIDFGEVDQAKKAGTLDFHILFGPNEAGKSTLRSAAIDFLYGFGQRSNYAFLHQSNTLQLDASISAGDQKYDLTRIKRTSKSLLGVDGQPVGDDLLLPLLGRVTRESYESMFSLDEDLLEEGGESILESKGDLSELLFSSASGLSALSAELANIRSETEQFFKPRGRTLRLNEMNKELKELKARIKELDVPATQYDARKKAERAAQESHSAALTERQEQSSSRIRLKALLDCAEPWRDYLELQGVLKEKGDLPILPEEWLAEAQQLATDSATAKAVVEQSQRRVAQTQAEIAGIEVATRVLDAGAQIDRLADDDLEAKFRAAADEQSTQSLLDAIENQIAQSVQRLNAPSNLAPQELPLPAARVGQIKALLASRSGLDASLSTATEEVERAQDELDRAQLVLEQLGETTDLSGLARLLAAIREDDDDRDVKRLDREHHAQQVEVEAALTALAPWVGTAKQLEGLVPIGAHDLQQIQKQEQDNAKRSASLMPEVERLSAQLARDQAAQQALFARGDLIDDTQSQRSRADRDSAWQAHKTRISQEPLSVSELKESAAHFEVLLGEDDRLASTRFAQAREVAALRELELSIARTKADQQQLDEKLQRLAQAQERTADLLASACSSIGLAQNTSSGNLERWLAARTDALRDHHKLLQLDAEMTAVDQRAKSTLARLHAALAEASVPANDETWLVSLRLADDAISGWRQQQLAEKEASKAVADCTQEIQVRQRRFKSAQAAMDAWDADWSAALAGLWPGKGDRLPAIAEMNEILRTLDELISLLAKASDARMTLAEMRSNRERYLQEVTRIAEVAGLPMSPGNPLETADGLRKQLFENSENQRRLQEKAVELDALQAELVAADDEQRRLHARFEEMARLFPADNHAQLIELMRRSEDRQRALLQSERLQRQLVDVLGFSSFDEAQQMLGQRLGSAEAIDALRVEHKEVVATSEDTDQEVSTLYHQWKAAQNDLRLIGDDAEVARLNEQVRVLLMDIELEAKRFVSLSAGTLLVERALRTYLDAHRGSMLEKASSSFATITRGAFTGLQAMPGIAGRSKEELVGIRHDGSSISATQMSRGSRFQLYLSLRIAGYHEFVAERDPLPFFADDILETFDDNRSAETFGLMADMARCGQVIYLTHHKHLCDLATEVTNGQAKIHELPARTINV